MGNFIAKHSPLFILAALCIVLALASPVFRSSGNLQGVAQRTAVVGIMAVGQLAVILTAGIDLSVGSIAALSGVLGCMAMVDHQVPMFVGILLGTAIG
ncbi:MAG TPA: ribose ABC transporter permease, partial [Candidatus Hydrogenedentes bacterium]|nr:ribose ABC transporter permease [Candidatus Hydrogenedentota bacterium]